MIDKDGDLALLASDDSTVNLSRDQMSQDTPTVKPVLKATSDGLKYWPAGSGQTPTGDAHVVITPTIDTSGGSTPTPGNSAPQIAVNVTMDAPWWPLGQAQVGVALKSTATGVSYQCSMLIKAFAANGSTKVELDRNVPTFTVPNADIAGTYNFSRSEFGSGYSPDHAEIVLSCTGFKDLTKSSK